MRKIHQNVPQLFAPHPWTVEETAFLEETNKVNETIFALGNGYLGVRGVFEEGYYGFVGNTVPGTVLNGVYEYHDYHYIWCRPGFPARYHSITNQVEAFQVRIFADGERIHMRPERVTDYRRVLDMQTGLLTRRYTYTSESGLVLRLAFERFVSLAEKHTAAMRVTITPSRDCKLAIESLLDGEIKSTGLRDGKWGYYPEDSFDRDGPRRRDGVLSVTNTTKVSGFTVATAVADVVSGAGGCAASEQSGGPCAYHRYEAGVKAGRDFTLERVACYAVSRDESEPEQTACSLAREQVGTGYDTLRAAHVGAWKAFWDGCGMDIDGDDALLQGLRFSMFHLNQGVGRDGVTNISANCLTGTSYSGWTFWDTEIFMMPMFLYTRPDIARQLLIYRYNILDKARERARQMDDKGALYAWSSINGEECAFLFEAATDQYHINPDIYFAIDRYIQATGDKEFLVDYGAEMLFEMSKCLAHRGSFIEHKGGQFCINLVCGPDEYSPVVNNNCYTNWLCRRMFYYTLKTAARLRESYPGKYRSLCKKCGVDDTELALWQRAADRMYIPYDKGLGLYLQDDQFLDRDPFDVESIPVSKLPLLNHLHPLNLWRYQVIKQADIVLLTYLCSEDFSPAEIKKIYDFYEPKTIHDSSLSAGVHSIVACGIGYDKEAYGYFLQSARMDLDNVNRNTDIGVHSACMGNTWQILTGGYAGMRCYQGSLHFAPKIPRNWKSYRFHIRFCNFVLAVEVKQASVTYTLLQGEKAEFFHEGKPVSLSRGNVYTSFRM